VVQAQAMLFDLKKLFIKWKDLCRASRSGRGKTTFGVRQNLFQMSGHGHCEFRLEVNLKLKISKAKIAPATNGGSRG